MITTPAICARRDLYRAINCPTSVATAPSETKTMLKPSTNIRELSMTLGKRPRSPAFSCSTPVPEISDT